MSREQSLERLQNRLARLEPWQLNEVEQLVADLEIRGAHDSSANASNISSRVDWPHAPLHRLAGKGTYLVTASTYQSAHHFGEARRLDLLQHELLVKSKQYGWQIEAWAIFSNHYHFVGHAMTSASTLKPFLSHLHADTAREVNRLEGKVGRQVWFNFWETELTYEKSYLARLNYVHQNAVKHRLVKVASQYHWCSASWFERTAKMAQVKTIYGFKIDRLKVRDDFEPLGVR